jgi:hypothetical protein
MRKSSLLPPATLDEQIAALARVVTKHESGKDRRALHALKAALATLRRVRAGMVVRPEQDDD